jgi:hypothetical protein
MNLTREFTYEIPLFEDSEHLSDNNLLFYVHVCDICGTFNDLLITDEYECINEGGDLSADAITARRIAWHMEDEHKVMI